MKKFSAQLLDAAGEVLYRSNPKLYEELKTNWPALVPTLRGWVAKRTGSNIVATRVPGKKIALTVANFTFLVGGKDTDSQLAPVGTFVIAIRREDADDWARKSNIGVSHIRRIEQLIATAALHKACKYALMKSEFASLVKVKALG